MWILLIILNKEFIGWFLIWGYLFLLYVEMFVEVFFLVFRFYCKGEGIRCFGCGVESRIDF